MDAFIKSKQRFSRVQVTKRPFIVPVAGSSNGKQDRQVSDNVDSKMVSEPRPGTPVVVAKDTDSDRDVHTPSPKDVSVTFLASTPKPGRPQLARRRPFVALRELSGEESTNISQKDQASNGKHSLVSDQTTPLNTKKRKVQQENRSVGSTSNKIGHSTNSTAKSSTSKKDVSRRSLKQLSRSVDTDSSARLHNVDKEAATEHMGNSKRSRFASIDSDGVSYSRGLSEQSTAYDTASSNNSKNASALLKKAKSSSNITVPQDQNVHTSGQSKLSAPRKESRKSASTTSSAQTSGLRSSTRNSSRSSITVPGHASGFQNSDKKSKSSSNTMLSTQTTSVKSSSRLLKSTTNLVPSAPVSGTNNSSKKSKSSVNTVPSQSRSNKREAPVEVSSGQEDIQSKKQMQYTRPGHDSHYGNSTAEFSVDSSARSINRLKTVSKKQDKKRDKVSDDNSTGRAGEKSRGKRQNDTSVKNRAGREDVASRGTSDKDEVFTLTQVRGQMRTQAHICDMDVVLSKIKQEISLFDVDDEEDEDGLAAAAVTKFESCISVDISSQIGDFTKVQSLATRIRKANQSVKHLQNNLMQLQTRRFELEKSVKPGLEERNQSSSNLRQIHKYLRDLRNLISQC